MEFKILSIAGQYQFSENYLKKRLKPSILDKDQIQR